MSNSARILVVDADSEARGKLKQCFDLEGYDVEEASGAEEMRHSIEGKSVDLMTLEVQMAGEDGFELARKIRASSGVPIIIISNRQDMIDRIVGLELGADDYIVKPFNTREVMARVRAVLRRYRPEPASKAINLLNGHGHASEKLKFESWIVDLSRRELIAVGGKNQPLTTAEFNLLSIFVKSPQQILSRDDLTERLKGHEFFPLDRSIDNLVSRLRRKIESDADLPQIIKSVRCIGYMFASEIDHM